MDIISIKGVESLLQLLDLQLWEMTFHYLVFIMEMNPFPATAPQAPIH